MSNEAEKDPKQQKQQHGEQEPTGSVNPPDQGQSNRPQDISKKNPSQGSDPQHKEQERPEDEKRRAS